jgi:phosphoribosylamine--glycine ligase
VKLLVIGSGGREHALVWKLAQSPHVAGIWSAPGNGGIAEERLAKSSELVQCVPVGAEDLPGLLKFAEDHRPDLTVVGPDNPLALGIVDLFQSRGLRIWGPNRKAAQFEASKVFSQRFMEKHGIPTARAQTFDDPQAARKFASALEGRLEGVEISLHALCDGRTARLFPTSQDHKQVFDGDSGPNTGGMGAYSPTPFLSEKEVETTAHAVLDPWLKGCIAEGIDFRGLLYPGIMLTAKGPKVLEFNARFGDPETQVYMARLDSDLLELLEASVDGKLEGAGLSWRPQPAVCVVMASQGYPGAYSKGKEITGLEEVARFANVKVFHAGTRREQNRLLTAGGRVLGITAWGPDLARAQAAAYQAVEKIRFDGAHYRRDIGAKALSKQR